MTHSRKGCFWLKLATVAIATERERLRGGMDMIQSTTVATMNLRVPALVLAGNEIHVLVPVSIYHKWEMLEATWYPRAVAWTPLAVS